MGFEDPQPKVDVPDDDLLKKGKDMMARGDAANAQALQRLEQKVGPVTDKDIIEKSEGILTPDEADSLRTTVLPQRDPQRMPSIYEGSAHDGELLERYRTGDYSFEEDYLRSAEAVLAKLGQ